MKVTNFPAEELDIKNVFALLDDHKFRVTNQEIRELRDEVRLDKLHVL
jgi:hypothetical protein